MANGVFGVGLSGLAAAQAGLVTTGHNITNANAIGFHRQTVQQSALPAQFTGSGFLGEGVQVDTVMRSYSQFLDTQVSQAQAQASYYSAYHTQLAQMDNVVADSNAGLSSALQEFFSAAQDVATNPAAMPSRQSLLSAGEALVSRFSSLAARFDELRNGVDTQLTSAIAEINTDAQQIALLNERIQSVQKNPSQPPNDLLDQRDSLVSRLNTLVGATVVNQSDGTINVVIGNGQNLVIGRQAMTLVSTPAFDDPRRMEVAYVSGASTVHMNESALQGGSLGGLLAFRSNELDAAQNALGRVAIGLAQTINDQHRLGQDVNGALGASFFSIPGPVVIGRTGNTGNAVIAASVASVNGLTTSDYRLSYTGANYTLTRLSDNTTTSYASLPQTVDGLTISLASGAAAGGDSFLIQPTRGGAGNITMNLGDPAQIAAAAPIRTAAPGTNTGSGTISAGTVNAPPPPNANLQQPVTITFTSATAFSVNGIGTTNPTGVAYTAGGNITYNGWTVAISGTPAAGDTFTVSPNSGGTADGRNALLLVGLQTSKTLVGGTANLQDAYSQMVSMVGNKTRQVDLTSQAQNKYLEEANHSQQALSGVNLDEEAAKLLQYQQAYQAAGKMMQIAETLFKTVLDLG